MWKSTAEVLVLFALLVPSATRADDFFRDGDRVVFLGSTVIEREQKYGYWETALTIANPKKNITFRNLGWSGDTVWGEARASFDPPAVGYKRLVEHTLALKPTVIFLCYGTNESFAGEAGLAKFVAQYNKLLDDLSPSKARFVLMAPPMFEKQKWLGNDFKRHADDLEVYSEEVKQVAKKRRALFIAAFPNYGTIPFLTDNGLHLSPDGFWYTAPFLTAELKQPIAVPRVIMLNATAPQDRVDETLFHPPEPARTNTSYDCFVSARELKPGKYTLNIDGNAIQTEDAERWLYGENIPDVFCVAVRKGPSLDQSEKLRQTIVEKNRLYFNRWRPANETYLFGFRKHEQGNNAVEIPKFDPLIAKLEADIARLRVPVKHTYQLVPAKEEKK
jgi:lysophospholipase L1-like esterase